MLAGNTVRTGVDDLVELLKQKKRISLDQAAKVLKVKLALLQDWVDFLVEEEIVGIEYEFLTPYIFMLKSENTQLETKEAFVQKARQKNIPPEKIALLWKKYVLENKDSIKRLFVKKAEDKGLTPSKIEETWLTYYRRLQEDV